MSEKGTDAERSEMQNRIVGKTLYGLIVQTIDSIDALGREFTTEREKLCELKSRLLEERFHLAILGQFNRGKSTLINALLGEVILPTAVVPLTAIPTLIRAGKDREVRISFADDRAGETLRAETGEELAVCLAKFVAESENPKNCLGVSQVEVFHPSRLLIRGVVLIDTPGIGSTFRHNTEAALNFLSQCDAAVFVSSADPPITEVEVLFLKEVGNKVEQLIYLFNKADYLDETEKQHALEFLKTVLRQEMDFNDNQTIYCVSARQGLEAKQNRDTVKWTKSGLEAFENHLVDFLVQGKVRMLNQALFRKTAGVICDIKMQLQIMVQSSQMPLAELDKRQQALVCKIDQIERQRIIAEDLLEGDQRQTLKYLEEQADNLRQKVREHLGKILLEHSAVLPEGVPDQMALEQAVVAAISGLFESEMGNMSQTFDRYVTDLLHPHQQRAEDLMGEIRRSTAELFDIPYYIPEAGGVFQMKGKLCWVDHQWSSSLNTIPLKWNEKLLSPSIQRSKIIKRLEEQVEALISVNVENLRWETLQNLNSTFQQFTVSMKEQLQLTLAATQGAIQIAWEKRQSQADMMDEDIKRLESAFARFSEIEKRTDYKQYA